MYNLNEFITIQNSLDRLIPDLRGDFTSSSRQMILTYWCQEANTF